MTPYEASMDEEHRWYLGPGSLDRATIANMFYAEHPLTEDFLMEWEDEGLRNLSIVYGSPR